MRLHLVFIAIAAAVLETALLVGIAAQLLSPLAAALAHIALSGGVLIWAFRLRAGDDERRWPLLLSVTLPLLGPLGPAGTLATMAATRLHRLSATSFEEWHESIFFPEESRGRIPESLQSAISGVSPFADVLAFGSVEQKQQLIALMTKEFRPEFATALRMALRDSNSAVRVQAASAVAKLENDFTVTTLKLAPKPGEPATADQLLRRAAHYASYAATGFLDSERERSCRENALQTYQSYLQMNPADSEAAGAYGKLLLELGRLNEAREWFTSSESSGGMSRQWLLLYMDVLFRLGCYTELRALAASYLTEHGPGDDVLDEAAGAVKLWAGAPC